VNEHVDVNTVTDKPWVSHITVFIYTTDKTIKTIGYENKTLTVISKITLI
jgi:hypothetical protein